MSIFSSNTVIFDRFSKLAMRIVGRIFPPPSNKTLQQLSKREMHSGLSVHNKSVTLQQGRTEFQAQNYADALAIFTQLTRLEPQNPWAWHGLGDSYQLLGNSKAAHSAYTTAIQLQPKEGLHYGGRGNANKGLNQLDAANSDWNMALKYDPSLTWIKSHFSSIKE
jgi:tetratricopeptide (TPR) repeat protein